jgi:hypothetical protein
MPWLPELFTAPALQQILDERRRDELLAGPYFDGLMTGDPDPLVESFAGEPEVHDAVRGRIKGERAFRAYVGEMSAWLRGHDVSVEDVDHVIGDRRGFEDVVLHFDRRNDAGGLPVAIVADRQPDGRIDELRLYYAGRPPAVRQPGRPPLLQPDPGLREPEAVSAYVRGFNAGDVDAVVAAFEPEGSVREATDDRHVHSGPAELRSYHERMLSDVDGVLIEPCTLVDDGRACALEYNLAPRAVPHLPAQAAACVFVLGQRGQVAALRVFDDAARRSQPWNEE